ncbi:ABC transporter permease [Mesorhizobium sp. M0578]|uniref:ABC transporter permease n=1 Tax=unclassified Mesorhizobium TaxID=325217 RepID=UPI0033385467
MANVIARQSTTTTPYAGKRIERILSPALVLLVFFIAWQFGSYWFDVPKYLVPAPSDFMVRFVTDRNDLAYSFAATGWVVVCGFSIATLIAMPLALAIASFSSLRRSLLPVIVFLEIIPKTITAPLLIVWFGFGFTPRIALTAVMTFFPILVNSIAGFSAMNPRLNLITRSMGASSWQTFRYIRLPAAMPFIFSGMNIGMVYAVSGCITAELVGANQGLEVLILSASAYMDVALVFAGIMATASLAMLLTGILLGFEKWMMPWRNDQ